MPFESKHKQEETSQEADSSKKKMTAMDDDHMRLTFMVCSSKWASEKQAILIIYIPN